MKVYIVSEDIPYEGSYILGVFATEESADKYVLEAHVLEARKKFKGESHYPYSIPNYNWVEWEVK